MPHRDYTAHADADSLRLLVESVADYAIFILDPQGFIVTWNVGAERLKGYLPDEIIGQNFRRFYQAEDLADGKPERELEIATAEGRYEEQGWRLRKDGSRFWANVVITALRDEGGELRGFGKVTRDMTAQKRHMDALIALSTELQRSNDELDRFADLASHDLKEPLRKILAYGELLQEEHSSNLGAEGLRYVGRMTAAAQRMCRLIEGLLTLSRVTHAPPVRVYVDLNQVLVEVLADLDARISELRATISAGPLPVIEGDPVQLRQLLQNLISNSLKFHRRGVPPLILISADDAPPLRGAPAYQITVADNGKGFQGEFTEQIFKPFVRMGDRDDVEGTGLGLQICLRVVERHGGTITASSHAGEGTTLVVTLPERFVLSEAPEPRLALVSAGARSR